MGIIKNGTISGNLPIKKTFVVHYPGYPSSISRALETPGGIPGITTARESPSNKLELHFRPDDPYAHPAWGEQRPCNGFLLKISKEDVKKDTPPESQPVLATSDTCLPEACPVLSADIVSRVSESYCFDGMADYQHIIPIHADIAQKKKRKWMEVKSLAGNNDLMDIADEDVMMLLPQFFAPKDMPDNLVLRLPVTSGQKKKEEAPTQKLNEIDVGPVFAIDFSVKEIPKVLNWEDFIVPGSYQWQWQIQQEIRKPPKQTTCNYKTGWFFEALLDNLRLRVAVRFVSVFPEPGYEDVFKSIQEEFERSEKTRIQKDALTPCQLNHQETSNDKQKYKSTNKTGKDGDVIADEDAEEMDDEDEELNVAADDDEISMSSHGYGDMENNSRAYLQGLFDSFPSSKPALHDGGDGSDGEYQIYEQEESNNALDDEDEDDDE